MSPASPGGGSCRLNLVVYTTHPPGLRKLVHEVLVLLFVLSSFCHPLTNRPVTRSNARYSFSYPLTEIHISVLPPSLSLESRSLPHFHRDNNAPFSHIATTEVPFTSEVPYWFYTFTGYSSLLNPGEVTILIPHRKLFTFPISSCLRSSRSDR
jgi:hypothetical protein